MWLSLEAGVARDLVRRHGATFTLPARDDATGRYGPRSLVVEAANSLLPEAGLESMVHVAGEEMARGLGGPLRTRLAATAEDDEPALTVLRERVLQTFGVPATAVGAMTLTDRVYLGRVLEGATPPVVGAGCVWWYGHWRATAGGPGLDRADRLVHAARAWQDRPTARVTIDAEIVDVIARSVGPDDIGLIARPV